MNQTFTILAITATSVAAQAAYEARLSECRAYITTYEARTANTANRRHYADCVNEIETAERPTPDWMKYAAFFGAVSLLIGFIVGGINAHRGGERSVLEISLSGFLSLIVVLFVDCILYLSIIAALQLF